MSEEQRMAKQVGSAPLFLFFVFVELYRVLIHKCCNVFVGCITNIGQRTQKGTRSFDFNSGECLLCRLIGCFVFFGNVIQREGWYEQVLAIRHHHRDSRMQLRLLFCRPLRRRRHYANKRRPVHRRHRLSRHRHRHRHRRR